MPLSLMTWVVRVSPMSNPFSVFEIESSIHVSLSVLLCARFVLRNATACGPRATSAGIVSSSLM